MTDDDDDDRSRDDDDRDTDRADEEHDRWRCLFGADCLVASPFHTSDECFTVEWAESYFADQSSDSGSDLPLA